MVKMKKKVSRFSLAALTLLVASAIAMLLSGATVSAYLDVGAGGDSDCTLVSTQGPSTTKQECGSPSCGWQTVCTACVPETASETVLVSAGYWDTCTKNTWVDGYLDYDYPPPYTVTKENSHTEWECNDGDYFCAKYGDCDCWSITVSDPPTITTVYPSPVLKLVPGYPKTESYSCKKEAVYDTKTVTKWVDKQEYKCDPNCWLVPVPGDITWELECPPAQTVTPIDAGGGGAPPQCYTDCVCSTYGDCCAGYSSASDPACQPKVCTAGQEVSRSCSGCKTATVTTCNSYGTATDTLTGQLDNSCTSGCVTVTPTPTPTPKVCTAGQEASRSCTGCKTATAKVCNNLGTATYDSTVTDNSCTGGCVTATPTPVPKPTPKSVECAQKPKECGSGFDAFNGAYDTVITWSYNIFADDCFKSEQQCGAGEKCNAATGSCEKAAAQAQTCNTVCSGDTAISWHLANAPGGGQYCAIDSQADCAAQGKLCEQSKGCVAKPAIVKQDCTSQGCPSGYYCSYYGVDLIPPGNTAFV